MSMNTAARSLSKNKRNTSKSNSLVRLYNQLDFNAKQAINQAFLTNVKCGRNHQTFHQCLNAFSNQTQERRKALNALDQIFPKAKFGGKSKDAAKMEKQVTRAYLKQTESSINKKCVHSMAKSNRKKEGSKDRATAGKTLLTRPPLAANATSAQKTSRKQGLPTFIQTSHQNHGQLLGQLNLNTKESSSTRARGAPKFIVPQYGITKNIGVPNALNRSSSYNKYETPGKNLNQSLYGPQGSQSIEQNKQRKNSQRVRSSCNSQNKINDVSKISSGSLAKLKINQEPIKNADLGGTSNRFGFQNQNESAKKRSNGEKQKFFSNRVQSAKGSRAPLVPPKPDRAQQNFRNIQSNRQMNRQYANQSAASNASGKGSKSGKAPLQPRTKSQQKNQLEIFETSGKIKLPQVQNQNEVRNSKQSLQIESEPLTGLNLTEENIKGQTSTRLGAFINNYEQINKTQIEVEKEESNYSVKGISRISLNEQSTTQKSQNSKSVNAASNVTQGYTDQTSEAEAGITRNNTETHGEVAGLVQPEPIENEDLSVRYSTPQKADQEKVQIPHDNVENYKQEDVDKFIMDQGNLNDDITLPLLSPNQRSEALNYGLSFNSKKMAMGPAFFNIRIMCDCLGKAIKRHIIFSQNKYWFLDELNKAKKERKAMIKDLKQKQHEPEQENPDELVESGTSAATAFSYQFKDDLKLKDQKKSSDSDFERNSDFAEEEKSLGSVEVHETSQNNFLDIQKSLMKGSSYDQQKINFIELAQVEEIRKEQLNKQKDDTSKNTISNKSYIQMKLVEKDKKIQKLTEMVQMYETGKITGTKAPQLTEVLQVHKNQDGDTTKYDSDIYKMSRAEFIMSQIDLDPIESNYSQEKKQESSHMRYAYPKGMTSNKIQKQQYASEDIQEQIAIRETDGEEINKTMVDGSINSVSQGKSLNQSSGKNYLNVIPVACEGDAPIPTSVKKEKEKELESKLNEQKEAKKKAKYEREEQMNILRNQLVYFDERMDVESSTFDEDMEIYDPSEEDIAAYGKYVTIASKMENESPIIALVYIERILLKTGILVNKYNWKRILLVCLCVASKVWDDDSLENVHFPKVMADVSLIMLNQLEKTFLDLFLNYDLVVKGSEYAKYYFIMRTLANDLRNESLSADEKININKKKSKGDDWAQFPLLQPISAPQMLQLQRNSAKAEIYLQERYEKEIIFSLANKFKGSEQKIREKRFLTGNTGAEDGVYEITSGMLSSTM